MAYPFATSGQLGVNVTDTFTPSTTLYPFKTNNIQFKLGQQITASDNSVWVYCLLGTGGCTGAGYTCTFDASFTAVMMSNSVGALGNKIGVPAAAGAVGDYLWLQVYGVCQAIQVAASCVQNVPLASTSSGTPGVLDDATGTGTKNLSGIIITTTVVSAGATPGNLNYPVIGTTN